ncbi:heavy metal translocating P-type ATPase [Nonlabens mediterrranea]|uniref:Heavy metal translocating P-type ATPase n=1 Tax=Nonlabens mediterrranea TaxID=1419947 RepID=A0ABS0A122_9FLAO|nr:heavy metal translocating P-type ATPase [Nonlabens mediterrranea]
MKHIYHIEGMTCNGCRADVENKLNNIDDVDHATVTLENEQAVINMATHISLNTFQQALSTKYHISLIEEKNIFENSAFAKAEPKQSKLQQLKPLFLILGYITIATFLLNYSRENWNEAMLDFMGLFFIVFSFFKILDLKGFPVSFKMYDPLAKLIPGYAWIYPFIETALGLMFLIRFQVDLALLITLIVLSITTGGVTKTLLDKKSIQCACLGTALKLPMTEATFIENAIMIIMAIIMLIS